MAFLYHGRIIVGELQTANNDLPETESSRSTNLFHRLLIMGESWRASNNWRIIFDKACSHTAVKQAVICCLLNRLKIKSISFLFLDYRRLHARACKYIIRAVIGQYSGVDFPVMLTGIMSDVNARLDKREYRKCESTFDSNSSNDLKLNKRGSLFKSSNFFLCVLIFAGNKTAEF